VPTRHLQLTAIGATLINTTSLLQAEKLELVEKRRNVHIWSLKLSKLTTWAGVLLGKLIIILPAKKFRAFYGTRNFIDVFTWAHHLTLSSARWTQSTSFYSFIASALHRKFESDKGKEETEWSMKIRVREHSEIFSRFIPQTEENAESIVNQPRPL
jgi:hypothetical protein